MNLRSIFFTGLLLLAGGAIAQHDHAHHDHSGHTAADSKMRYVQNDGQWPDQVLYRMNSAGASMFLQEDGVLWTRLEDGASDMYHDAKHDPAVDENSLSFQAHAWKVQFVGANKAETRGLKKATEYHNYFLGSDASKWAGGVPLYEEVMYSELWNGVDLRWHGVEGNVKYDLIVAAGTDASEVGFRYEGLSTPAYVEDGQLVICTSVGTFREMAPVAWYADSKAPIECQFVMNDGVLGFEFQNGRDMSRAVVIDPLLIGATYSGVTGQNIYGHCATFDDSGNIYSGGQAFGPGLPASIGAFQAVFGGGFGTDINVNKFSPDASIQIWATYLGGGADEKPHSLIANAAGEMTLLGSATGAGYPVTANAFQTAFGGGNSDIVVTRLNAAGTALIGSTYVGGSDDDGRQNFNPMGNYSDTFRGEIMMDVAGNNFVASSSSSANFPTTTGAYQTALAGNQDAVVFGLNPSCSAMIWSTFYGGTDTDNGLGMRFAGNGDAILVGGTASANLPMLASSNQATYQGGAADGYLARFSANGTVLSGATYFGTSDDDINYFVDLDNFDDIFVYGQSRGTIPLAPATNYGQAGGMIYIAKFDPNLSTVILTSPLGPTAPVFGATLTPVAFLVDVCNHIYISGFNPTGAWATTPNALYTSGGFYQAAYDVNMDTILYGSYFGGSHVDGGTSRFDKNGIVYQGVCSGGQSMPTTPTAFAPTNNVGWDIGVFKIDFQVAGVNAIAAGTLNTGCAPVAINFINNSIGNQFIWDFGDGSPLDTAMVPTHTYTTSGAFTVTLIAMDSLSCNLADTVSFPITIGQAQPLTAGFTFTFNPDCNLFQISTTNNSVGSPMAFEWDMGDGSPLLTDTNVVHNYPGPGSYDITLVSYDPAGCSQPDTVMQTVVIPNPITVDAGFTLMQVPDCNDLIVSTTDTTIGPSPTWSWDMGDGSPLITTQNVSNHIYSTPGTYTITLIVTDNGSCNIMDTATAQITVNPLAPIAAGMTVQQVPDCSDLIVTASNTSVGDSLIFNWNMGDGTLLTDTNVTHTYTTAGTYTIQLTVTDAWGCFPPDIVTTTVTLDPIQPVVANMNILQTGNCTTLEVDGLNLSTGDSLAYLWTMGDGTVLTDTNVTYQYVVDGSYTVQLLITDLTGCNPPDSVSSVVSVVGALPVQLSGNNVLCPGSTLNLDGTWPGAIFYQWNTGDTTASIVIDQPGVYYVDVIDSLCNGTDTITITPAPVHDLYYEVDACPDALTDLSIPLPNAQLYNWENGANTQGTTIIGPGIYTYDLLDADGCFHEDSVLVIPIDSSAVMYAPNAFSPDGDGINDIFYIMGYGEIEVQFDIFNRWGELLHTSLQKGPTWDGTYKGKLVQHGVYVYRMSYASYCSPQTKVETFGHVTVIR